MNNKILFLSVMSICSVRAEGALKEAVDSFYTGVEYVGASVIKGASVAGQALFDAGMYAGDKIVELGSYTGNALIDFLTRHEAVGKEAGYVNIQGTPYGIVVNRSELDDSEQRKTLSEAVLSRLDQMVDDADESFVEEFEESGASITKQIGSQGREVMGQIEGMYDNVEQDIRFVGKSALERASESASETWSDVKQGAAQATQDTKDFFHTLTGDSDESTVKL